MDFSSKQINLAANSEKRSNQQVGLTPSQGFSSTGSTTALSSDHVFGTSIINSWKPAHTDMTAYRRRYHSFARWPKQIEQRPEFLARSGFYYSGCGDLVTCFYCGLTLKEWEFGDGVNFEHKRFSPGCKYLSMVYDN